MHMQQGFEKVREDTSGVLRGSHERRAEARHVVVRWLAELEIDGTHAPCVVHDICATGLIAEVSTLLRTGDEVRIALGDSQRLEGTIVWARDANVEVRWREPVDVGALLDLHDHAGEGSPDAPTRLEISCRGWLELGKETFMVEVCDLSQSGARVAADVAPAPGQRAVLLIEGLPPLGGEVRWRYDGKLGIAFDEAVPVDTLAHRIVPRDAQVGAHARARRWPRYSILLKTAARLPDLSEPVEVIVHNISRGGVFVSCRRGLRMGDPVEIDLGPARRVAGRIMWVGDGKAGIEFDRTIDTAHVLHPVGARGAPPLLHHHVIGRRPGLNSHKGH